MKALCLTTDNQLISGFSGLSCFSTVDVVGSFNTFFESDLQSYQVLIISDRKAVWSSLEDIRDKAPDSTIFFMVSNYPDSKVTRQIQLVCLNQNINLISPRQTVDQILDKVLRSIAPDAKDQITNVISFFGTHPRAGVTTTVLNTANRLSNISKIKIGVLGLNAWNPGDCFINKYEGSYLDEIKTLLSNNILEQDLLNSMSSVNRFKYLAGNRDVKKRLHYSVDEISCLIDVAKNAFDLIFIDAGSHYDNALSIQSLFASDLRLVIGTQEPAGKRCWEIAFEQVLEPLGYLNDSFLMICNKYKDNVQFFNSKQLQEIYDIAMFQTIPNVGDLGLIAENDKSLLCEYGDKDFNDSINRIVKSLVKLYNIPVEHVESKSDKSFFRRLFG